ncbi:MAG: hypothetical protein AAB586_00045 [Patescibacteria group bacterium]
MRKKQFIAITLLLALLGLLLPVLPAQAQGLPFGGIVSSRFPCTCSATLRIRFNPLYLGGPTVTSGALVYSPFSTLLYANLNIGVPGKWHIGSYLPGVRACWAIITWWLCLPLPTLGLMTKVGTN